MLRDTERAPGDGFALCGSSGRQPDTSAMTTTDPEPIPTEPTMDTEPPAETYVATGTSLASASPAADRRRGSTIRRAAVLLAFEFPQVREFGDSELLIAEFYLFVATGRRLRSWLLLIALLLGAWLLTGLPSGGLFPRSAGRRNSSADVWILGSNRLLARRRPVDLLDRHAAGRRRAGLLLATALL